MSTDRDNKVRVSILPPHGHRMGGAHEVQAFCLGHTNFVTSSAAVVSDSGAPEARLVTTANHLLVRLAASTSTFTCQLW